MGRRLPDQPPVDLDAECRCPRTRHQHGTAATYAVHACRCRPCRDAVGRAARHRYRQQAYGRPALIPTTRALEHIAELRDQGMSVDRIAVAAGLHHSHLASIVYGPTRSIRPAVEAAILAVVPAPTPRVNPRGAVRRVQALACLGWTMRDVEREIGMTRDDRDDEPSNPQERHVGLLGVHPDDIALMLRTCATSWEAATRLGIDRAHLLKRTGKLGIHIPAHIVAGDEDRRQMQLTERWRAA